MWMGVLSTYGCLRSARREVSTTIFGSNVGIVCTNESSQVAASSRNFNWRSLYPPRRRA